MQGFQYYNISVTPTTCLLIILYVFYICAIDRTFVGYSGVHFTVLFTNKNDQSRYHYCYKDKNYCVYNIDIRSYKLSIFTSHNHVYTCIICVGEVIKLII